MLTLAGLSLGKDIPLLKNIGWKIIPVGLVAMTASFLLSTVIAEFALGLWHWPRPTEFLSRYAGLGSLNVGIPGQKLGVRRGPPGSLVLLPRD